MKKEKLLEKETAISLGLDPNTVKKNFHPRRLTKLELKNRLKDLGMGIMKESIGGRGKFAYKPHDLVRKCQEYFLTCVESEKNLTITGLCLSLGIGRDQFNAYLGDIVYGGIVTRARTVIENFYENKLIERGNAGDIFALKNFGWTDKQELVVNQKNLNLDVNKLTESEINEKLLDYLSN